MRKFIIARIFFIPLAIAAYLVTLYAQDNPAWTEQVYSQSVYPVLSSTVGLFPSLVGFSVAEWFVILFVLFCLWYIGKYLFKIIKGRGRRKIPADQKVPAESIAPAGPMESTDPLGSTGPLASTESMTPTGSVAPVDPMASANPTASIDPLEQTDSIAPVDPLAPADPAVYANPMVLNDQSIAPDPMVAIDQNVPADQEQEKPRPKKKRSALAYRGMLAYRGIMGLVAIFCVVYVAFTALCGLNYYRYPFSSYTGYTVEESNVEDLKLLCTSLASEMGQTRAQIGNDVDLSVSTPEDFEFYAQHSVVTMQLLAEQYPVLDRPLYSNPKPVLFSGLMSDAGIGGVFFPFTLESNINTEPPFFTLPSTMTHELAHQCGFMREDEANFIAYLACKKSEDPLMRYSGLFLAFNHSISALNSVDPGAAAEILSTLPPGIQQDREQNRQFWAEHDGVVQEMSNNINDAYLKANDQVDGVQSYGRMVDLLIAEQKAGI